MTGSDRSSGVAGRFAPAEIRALAILVAGGTHEAAAIAARRTPRTIRRWIKTERFQTEITEQSREILDAAVQHLQAGALRAAKALVSMAGGDVTASASRVAAARATLELARGATEIAELEEMVIQLAAKLEARKGFPQ